MYIDARHTAYVVPLFVAFGCHCNFDVHVETTGIYRVDTTNI